MSYIELSRHHLWCTYPETPTAAHTCIGGNHKPYMLVLPTEHPICINGVPGVLNNIKPNVNSLHIT